MATASVLNMGSIFLPCKGYAQSGRRDILVTLLGQLESDQKL